MSQTEIKPGVEVVTFTVNGNTLQAPKNASLLQTLLDAGYNVPHYCYHPSLSIDGSCRLCFIQLEKDPRVHISCNMKVAEGLAVLTETETVLQARQGMMEFLLVNHPLDCPICDKGGECMLQRYSMDHGQGAARTSDYRRRYEKPQFDPLIDLERNRCILCTRCVRFCDEIAETHVMGIVERGDRDMISTFNDTSIDTIYSGNVIDICPVGALTSKPFRFTARNWELSETVSTCVYCSTGCDLTAWVRDGSVKRCTSPVVRKGEAFTLNEDTKDFICNVGRFYNDFNEHADRLLMPLIRDAGKTIETGWGEAIQTVADGLKAAAKKHGPESVAFLAGPRATNEEYYLLQRLAREVMRTPHIDWRTQLADAEACRAHSAALAAADGSEEDLERGGVVIIVEASLSQGVPIFALRAKEAAKHKRNQTILIGSRNDDFIGAYAAAKVSTKPGGAADMLRSLAGGDAMAGNSGDDAVRTARELMQGAESGLIVYGLSEDAGAGLPELVGAVLALKHAMGPNWKTLPVAFERNAVGAFAAGAQPDRLPGGAAGNEARQGRVSAAWKAELPSGAGLSAPEILQAAADGKIKALFVLGQDSLRNAPDAALVEKAMSSVEFLAVQDFFPGPATERAHVLLPGATFTEKDGSMCTLGGKLGRLAQGSRPMGSASEDRVVLQAIAEAMGHKFEYSTAESVFNEFIGLLDPPKKIRYFDLSLDAPGPEWPIRPEIYTRTKSRPDWRVRFGERVEYSAKGGASGATAGAGGGSGSGVSALRTWRVDGPDHMGDRSAAKKRVVGTLPIVSLNPATAAGLNLKDGQEVSGRAGSGGGNGAGDGEAVRAVVRVSAGVSADAVQFAANDFPGWAGASRIDLSA